MPHYHSYPPLINGNYRDNSRLKDILFPHSLKAHPKLKESTFENVLGFVLGFLIGAVDVLPTDSVIPQCKNNITELIDNTCGAIHDFGQHNEYCVGRSVTYGVMTDSDRNGGVRHISKMVTYPYGIFYNCGYGTTALLAGKTGIWKINEIHLNLLWNFGHMYNDGKGIYFHF